MNKALSSFILGSSVLMAGCADKKIDTSKVDCLATVQDTREAALALCRLPTEATALDVGKLGTPSDVQFFETGKAEGFSVAKVKIAPGRTIHMVVRKDMSQWYMQPDKRVQIFENGKLIAEKLYQENNAATEANGHISYEAIGRLMDELFGTNRINVREFVDALTSRYPYQKVPAAVEIKSGTFSERSRFSDEKFNSSGEYRDTAGDKVLHGKGERSWTVVMPRESFRTFYEVPTDSNFFVGGALPYRVEEKGIFEDGFLAEGSRKLHFSTGPNPYVETGKMAYTGRMLSANLENGTIQTPNGIKYTVTNGVVMPGIKR